MIVKEKKSHIPRYDEDETLMSKEDFFAKINKSLAEIKEGKATVASTKEELAAFLESV
ncbi:MAG: hypothetical protein LBG47_02390 [Prevotellaceae bacterium]|nr:hypothetical protein [Prevotellaceae bacterium]